MGTLQISYRILFLNLILFHFPAICDFTSNVTGATRPVTRPPAATTPTVLDTKNIVNQLYKNLEKSNNSFMVNENGSFEMTCNDKLIKDLMGKHPSAAQKWLHNGEAFKLDTTRMQYSEGKIVIKKVTVNDTGVYICQIDYSPDEKQSEDETIDSVKLYALTVKSANVFKTTKGSKRKLTCNGGSIGQLFKGKARQKWFCNSTVMKDYQNVPPELVNTDKIKFTGNSMEGIWTCEITGPNGNKWVTNRINVKVSGGIKAVIRRLEEHKVEVVVLCVVINVVVPICLIVLWVLRKRDIEAHQITKKLAGQSIRSRHSKASKSSRASRKSVLTKRPPEMPRPSQRSKDGFKYDRMSQRTSGTSQKSNREAMTYEPQQQYQDDDEMAYLAAGQYADEFLDQYEGEEEMGEMEGEEEGEMGQYYDEDIDAVLGEGEEGEMEEPREGEAGGQLDQDVDEFVEELLSDLSEQDN